MTHEFMTTPSKLDCALPMLHPEHSNARGAIIRVRLRDMIISVYIIASTLGLGSGSGPEVGLGGDRVTLQLTVTSLCCVVIDMGVGVMVSSRALA